MGLRDICCPSLKLYIDRDSNVQVKLGEAPGIQSDRIPIEHGLRQGCPASPILSNISIEFSAAGHNRLIFVACAPWVANASTFPRFENIEDAADMLPPALQTISSLKMMPWQANTSGLLLTLIIWPSRLENDRSHRQNLKFQVVLLQTITMSIYTTVGGNGAFHRPQQWVEGASASSTHLDFLV
jgi:hypothetical protein